MSAPRRHWGQHWLASDALADRLAGLVDARAGESFLEIGPGRGRLTGALLRRGSRVVAVEVDPECCDALRARQHPDLRVVPGDILETDVGGLVDGPVRWIGNLPYYISSPILQRTCEDRGIVVDAHYMLAAEVAERVVAKPGGRDYGALSVRLQWDFEIELLSRLSPGAFRPPPRIDSAFIALRPRTDAHPAMTTAELQLVHDAFAHRRKTLANSLAARGRDKDRVRQACRRAGIDPGRRAETLAVQDFRRLHRALRGMQRSAP